ncbi:hypothetical protein IRP63_14285 (plasmid) [Clostridium botulinum]|uniref:Uncharacterized protein n=1 Tax=Clostridium botulinum C/D str. DC5 TaxID=1443128 RepID=A0A0A0HY26_CLOBO|nr:hypothetical protein [Clostridium botulinum]KGM93447.1 hypothetical protein Z955_14970 [Clostridium botulinum C/D str. DC5]KOC56846.1 hypothetical protein ADU89_01190 [Clostridium botulinum]KOC57321.1 hypothetical protein ADU90_05730 [Clostridium botulinum]MCD3232548.1 hypothetical protein [Clostridium botulinum D/C]MCD3238523.1 hypothetical protein [Clostridium botulinum D/C]
MLKRKLHIIANSTRTKLILLFATIGICVVTSVSIGENVNVNNTDVIIDTKDNQINTNIKDLLQVNNITKDNITIQDTNYRLQQFDEMVNKAQEQLEKLEKEKQETIQKQQHKQEVRLSRGSNNPYQGRLFDITASHYSGREEENGKGRAYRNALGKALTYQTIAVPRNIPLGSLIKLIDNEGNTYIKIALDYGSTKHIRWIDSNTMKIDVCKPYASRKEIDNLGIKHYRGEIVRWGF